MTEAIGAGGGNPTGPETLVKTVDGVTVAPRQKVTPAMPQERVRGRAIRNRHTGCWEWQGSKYWDGYGRWQINKVHYLAHRVAYASWHGPVQSTTVIRHTCDNPACINPEHLIAGTQEENVRDRQDRGRQARGERNGRAKVTADQVRAMRESGKGPRELAREYDLSSKTVSDLLRGVNWSSL